MSRTSRNTAFRRQLGEAMSISPTRRAKEQREALKDIMDFVLDGSSPAFPHIHPYSDEYESGDVTFVR